MGTISQLCAEITAGIIPDGLSWKDFFANAVFFVLDIALISILVPILLGFVDNRKWARAREKIGILTVRNFNNLNMVFDALHDKVKIHCEYEDNTNSSVLINHILKEIVNTERDIEAVINQYIQDMQLMSPAFNSEIAISSASFYDAILALKTSSLQILVVWKALLDVGAAIKKDDYLDSNLRLRQIHHAAEQALSQLCQPTKLTAKREESFKFTVRTRADKRKIYPSYSSIPTSMVAILDLLVPLSERHCSGVFGDVQHADQSGRSQGHPPSS